jgi:hypothetical protein
MLVLCSRSARPRNGLARRPQSKTPHPLAWLVIELEEKVRKTRAVEDQSAPIPEEITSKLGRIIIETCSFDVCRKGNLATPPERDEKK